jgi:recombination protein RecA
LAADKKRRLEQTVNALRDRWGVEVIGRAKQPAGERRVAHIPTGFPDLDRALGVGGLPRGRISEIAGVPTSGMATLALRILAQAQQLPRPGGRAASLPAVYLDIDQTFDPDYAARCGVDLSRLLLVRPRTMGQGLHIGQDFLSSGATPFLILDAPSARLADPKLAGQLAITLDRVLAPLSKAAAVLLCLVALPPGSRPRPESYPAGLALPHYAAVRLFIRREQWLYRDEDIYGYQAQVLIAKNKLGPTGQQVAVAITFSDGHY